jgi:glycerol-3-phosphate acyltransferase PlsY
MPGMITATLILLAYLLGACPFGLLVARVCGVNIRDVGSGNIGATNVFRMVGKRAGVCVFILDALKGFVPVFFFPSFAHSPLEPTTIGLGCGVAAIVGHNFPIYLKFKGGKGVATSTGVLFGLAPIAAAIGIVSWIVLLLLTGYVSLASMGAAIAVPVAGWSLYQSSGLYLPCALTVLGALIIARHHSNIRRLIDGSEHRFQIWRRGKRTQTKAGT